MQDVSWKFWQTASVQRYQQMSNFQLDEGQFVTKLADQCS